MAVKESHHEALDLQSLPAAAVKMIYTNYRGETNIRLVIPERVWFGTSDHHEGQQWFLDAVDVEKEAVRSFALKDVRCWLDR